MGLQFLVIRKSAHCMISGYSLIFRPLVGHDSIESHFVLALNWRTFSATFPLASTQLFRLHR